MSDEGKLAAILAIVLPTLIVLSFLGMYYVGYSEGYDKGLSTGMAVPEIHMGDR